MGPAGQAQGLSELLSRLVQVSKSVSAPVTPSPVPNSSLPKRMKKSKQPLQVTKDLGRWKPADDLLLINAVLQVMLPSCSAGPGQAGTRLGNVPAGSGKSAELLGRGPWLWGDCSVKVWPPAAAPCTETWGC